MRIELPCYFGYEYVLDEQKLRDVCSTLIKQMALITPQNEIITHFRLKIKDLTYGYEASSEISSIDEVFLQDNGDVWIIQELELTVANKDHPDLAQITVEFRKYEYSQILSLELSASSLYSIVLTSMLESGKSLIGDKKHYSVRYLIVGSDRDWINQTRIKLEERLAKVKKIRTNLIAQCLVSLALFVALFGSLLYFTRALNFSVSTGYIILIYFVLFLLLSLGIVLSYGFPPHNFYWGEYKSSLVKRQKRTEFAITVVIIGLAISVFGGILAFIITK
jgi:hypothetical protein